MFKHSDLEIDKDDFKVAKMHLQKMILKKKKSYFEEELGRTGTNWKNSGRTLEIFHRLKGCHLLASMTPLFQEKLRLNKC